MVRPGDTRRYVFKHAEGSKDNLNGLFYDRQLCTVIENKTDIEEYKSLIAVRFGDGREPFLVTEAELEEIQYPVLPE